MDRLADYPAEILGAAVEAVHAAETGRGYGGETVNELPSCIAAAVRGVHIWRATRRRVDASVLEMTMELSVKQIEVWTGKK